MKYLYLMAALSLPSVAMAEIVIPPLGYTVDQATDEGSYKYHDWTDEQLIDGTHGGNNLRDNFGNGSAYEWLGWLHKDINIDFTFDREYAFNSVTVHSYQDHLNDVVLPSIRVFGWAEQWVELDYLFVPESEDNNYNRHALTLNQLSGFRTDRLRVSLERSFDGPWTFADEITFQSNQSPASIAADVNAPWAFSGALLTGLAGFSRRKVRQNQAQ